MVKVRIKTNRITHKNRKLIFVISFFACRLKSLNNYQQEQRTSEKNGMEESEMLKKLIKNSVQILIENY